MATYQFDMPGPGHWGTPESEERARGRRYNRRWRHRQAIKKLKEADEESVRRGRHPSHNIISINLRDRLRRVERLDHHFSGYVPPEDLLAGHQPTPEREAIDLALSSWRADALAQWGASSSEETFVEDALRAAGRLRLSPEEQEEAMGSKTGGQMRREKGGYRCSHNDWLEIVKLIDEAQEHLGSIKLVSTRVKMNEGWAAKVKEHHLNIITQPAVSRLKRLVADLRADALVKAAKEAERAGIVSVEGAAINVQTGVIATGSAMHTKRTSAAILGIEDDLLVGVIEKNGSEPPSQLLVDTIPTDKIPAGDQRQRRRLKELVDALGDAGLQRPEIMKALGYGSWEGVRQALTHTAHIPRWRLDRGASVLDAIRQGDYAEAERLWNKPRPIDRAPDERPEEQHLSGVELRRIGPPAKPPRVVPSKPTVTAPAPKTPPPVPLQTSLHDAWLISIDATGLDADVVRVLKSATPIRTDDVIRVEFSEGWGTVRSIRAGKVAELEGALRLMLAAGIDLRLVEAEAARHERQQQEVELPSVPSVTPTPPATLHGDPVEALRDELTLIALTRFDEIKKTQPKRTHPTWDAARDELLNFIQSLE